MIGRPTWWCDKTEDGASVLRVSCKVPCMGEWRSQYKMHRALPTPFAIHVAVEILSYELAFMDGVDQLMQPSGLMAGAK